MFDVALPIEIGGHIGQAAKAQFALAPLVLAHPAIAQFAPERGDVSADDGEIRQEYRKREPAHQFVRDVVDGLRPKMHQQVDDERVCRQRVERDHSELAGVEAKDAEQKHDETAEQYNVSTIVHLVDDVHHDGNRGQNLKAGKAGIVEAKVESGAHGQIQTQIDRNKRCRSSPRGRCRKQAERPGKRHQGRSHGVGERGKADAAQTQSLLRIERGRDQ